MKEKSGLVAMLLWSLVSSVIWSFVNALYIRFIDTGSERFWIIDAVDLLMVLVAKIDPLSAPTINTIFRSVLSDANGRLLAGPGLTIGTAFGVLASLYIVGCSASKAITTFLNGPDLQNSLRRFRLTIYIVEATLCLLAVVYVCLYLLASFDAATVSGVLKYTISAFAITTCLYGLASFAAYWCVPAVRQIASKFGFRR